VLIPGILASQHDGEHFTVHLARLSAQSPIALLRHGGFVIQSSRRISLRILHYKQHFK